MTATLNEFRTAPRVLEVSASARGTDSVSRSLTGEIVEQLAAQKEGVSLARRDLSEGIGLVDEAWVGANFTAEEERTPEQRAKLAESDALVAELEQADILVIGSPIYNFGIPASLKAWVDMIARARLTFRYTENGPEGLLTGKKAYVVIASGGVPVDSPVDFATPYLRHALKFVGITDVEVVTAEQLNARGQEAVDDAREQIARLFSQSATVDGRAA